jgi:hypothetical protein
MKKIKQEKGTEGDGFLLWTGFGKVSLEVIFEYRPKLSEGVNHADI